MQLRNLLVLAVALATTSLDLAALAAEADTNPPPKSAVSTNKESAID